MLFPTQTLFLRRLLVYWLLVALAGMVPWMVFLGYGVNLADRINRSQRTMMGGVWVDPAFKAQMTTQFGSWRAYLDYEYPLLPDPRLFSQVFYRTRFGPAQTIPALILSWPWLTLGALLIFQASLRRAQIRTVHMLRCILYSADALFLVPVALLLWTVSQTSLFLGRIDVRAFVTLYLPLVFVLLTHRLWLAYRSYLRFRHAFATVLASQVIVFLLLLKIGLDSRLLGW